MATPANNEMPPTGVRGWLLLFCIVLGVATPLVSFAGAGRNLYDLATRSFPLPIFRQMFMVEAIGLLVRGALCAWAGVQLWRRKPSGPKVARLALVSLVLYSLVELALAFGLKTVLAPEVWRKLLGGALKALAGQTLYAITWLTYLHESKRVRATYGSAADQRDA